MDRGRGRALAMRESARGVFFFLGGVPVCSRVSHTVSMPRPRPGGARGEVPTRGVRWCPGPVAGAVRPHPPGREAGGGDRAAGVRPG